VGGLGEPERLEVPADVHGHRLAGQAHVVAALVEQRVAPRHEPPGAVLEHRHPARAEPGPQARELVGVVTGHRPEPLGQPQVGGGQEVHGQVAGVHRHAVGVVCLGQPDAVPRGLDARLAVEPHQAARPLPALGGGHHDQRHVQGRVQGAEPVVAHPLFLTAGVPF
jgi:hypothetical protein